MQLLIRELKLPVCMPTICTKVSDHLISVCSARFVLGKVERQKRAGPGSKLSARDLGTHPRRPSSGPLVKDSELRTGARSPEVEPETLAHAFKTSAAKSESPQGWV
ncbi:hypothetical protein NL676_021762 [Syzygium grande]|nr:hypothetical protein NL676_021762 [Syzygium grande]